MVSCYVDFLVGNLLLLFDLKNYLYILVVKSIFFFVCFSCYVCVLYRSVDKILLLYIFNVVVSEFFVCGVFDSIGMYLFCNCSSFYNYAIVY